MQQQLERCIHEAQVAVAIVAIEVAAWIACTQVEIFARLSFAKLRHALSRNLHLQRE
jgi:hypothetical protein